MGIQALRKLDDKELAARPWLEHGFYDPVNTPIELVKLMEEGATDPIIYRELAISKATFYRWRNQHEEFKKAYEYGLGLRDAYHDHVGISNYQNPNFNAVAWQMIGRRHFRYTEHRTLKIQFNTAKNYEERANVLLEALAKGEISPHEGLLLSNVIANLARTQNEMDLQKRVEKLEDKKIPHIIEGEVQVIKEDA